jgi:hypothetical protein
MGVPTNLARAKQLAVYWDNYINYLTNLDDRQPNIGQGKDKPPQTELFIKPFALDLDTDQYLKVNATAERWNAFGTPFANYAKASLDSVGGEIFLQLRNVSPAKMVIKTGLSTTKQVVTAKTTKRKYVTRGGESGSIPFGKNTPGETEVEAYNALRAAVIASSAYNANTMQISRIKEKA